MALSLSAFPRLSDSLLGKLRIINATEYYEFYYFNEGTAIGLECQPFSDGSNIFQLSDTYGLWSPDNFALNVKQSFSIKCTDYLFGKDGIACSNAVLGVAVIWKSGTSKQRGAIPVGEIRNGENVCNINFDYQFDKAQLRGKITFSTILYIKQIGTPKPDEHHLANMYGCILGELQSFHLILDGSGSEFPVFEKSEPGKPLWYVRCIWEDPTIDQFYESVELYLNTAHPSYHCLVQTDKKYDPQLMVEIMSGALQVIIEKLKSEPVNWEAAIQGKSLQKGSVAEAVNYFINTLGIDVSTPENLAITLRTYIEKRM